LQGIEREIESLDGQQVDRKRLRAVFQEFSQIYDEAPLQTKRRLLNVVVQEIRYSVKRGEDKGDILYKLRGDGSVRKEWEEAQKHEDPEPPSSGGSSLQCALLPETHENSNYILLRIPIEIHLFQRGLRGISMDPDRLPEVVGLSDQDVSHLRNSGLVHTAPTGALSLTSRRG
jgi:hypothetical protein